MTQQQISTRIKVAGAPVVSANSVAGHIPAHLADKINSIRACTGRNPNMGWFLLFADDSLELDRGAPVSIEWVRSIDNADPEAVTFSGFHIVDAHKVLPNHVDSPLVVTVADARQRRIGVNARYTESSWQDILNDICAVIPGTPTLTLVAPPLAPDTVIYEGVDAWDAIVDVCSRTGHVLFQDPLTGQFKLAKLSEEQSIESVLNEARLWDQEVPTTPDRESIGRVSTLFRAAPPFDDMHGSAPQVDTIDNPSGGVGHPMVWGYGVPEDDDPPNPPLNQEALTAEATAIANTWFAWSEKQATRAKFLAMNFLQLSLGSSVSQITWMVKAGNTLTEVVIGEHSPPKFLVPAPLSCCEPDDSSDSDFDSMSESASHSESDSESESFSESHSESESVSDSGSVSDESLSESDSFSGPGDSESESASHSESKSESESVSASHSDSDSEDDGCAYTGSVVVVTGAYRSGGNICLSRNALEFSQGKLCNVVSVPPVCVPCCDDDESESSASESSASESSISESDGCEGGRIWNGESCVCPEGFEWDGFLELCTAVVPPPGGGGLSVRHQSDLTATVVDVTTGERTESSLKQTGETTYSDGVITFDVSTYMINGVKSHRTKTSPLFAQIVENDQIITITE